MDHPEDDDRPLTFRRALRMPEYWLLLVTAWRDASGWRGG